MNKYILPLIFALCVQFCQAQPSTRRAAFPPPVADTLYYAICPQQTLQQLEGWGISLCWWANMCGRWDDEKIDELVDWLVSPTGLNFNIFRYNIGGGDDPQNRNCKLHHMGRGKGLRAEMEGFKDSSEGTYHWERDAAQRKIMLKIKERRPDAIFEAFSNSAPYYMTYSGCVGGATKATDNNLRPEYYEEFAHYLVDVCRHYRDTYGIEFKTLEPFNEPVTDYWYANGSQEGCHVSTEAQIQFLRILSPILKDSGLKTVISASDETNVAQSVNDLHAYIDAGVLPLVGQWNTHTYHVSDSARIAMRELAAQHGIHLWQSEVGDGGFGIDGNLKLAQKLIDDMRMMQPAAWIDWQYVEEDNDQWCFVRSNFAQATYARVKNFYVRQQFSRFFTQGCRFLATESKSSLAATTADGRTLVLALLNTKRATSTHVIDLSAFQTKKGIQAFRTSRNEDLLPVSDYQMNRGTMVITLPPRSIVTLQIPIRNEK